MAVFAVMTLSEIVSNPSSFRMPIIRGSISAGVQYSATKAGVIGLTRHLASLWGGEGVRVNCLVPGGVDSGQNDVFRKKYSHRVPLGRMATADDLIGASSICCRRPRTM